MKKKLYLLVIVFFIFEMGYSQITNTRGWRKTERDSLDNALLLYDEKNYLMALPELEVIHKNHLNENFIKYLYGKCCMYRTDKHDEAYQTLFEVYESNKKVDNIEYDLAKSAHAIGYLPEASTYVEACLKNKRTSPEAKKDAELLRRYINNAKFFAATPTKAKITNVGNVINTADDEYVPCITADESVLIYTTEGVKCKGGRMNVYLQPDPNGSYTEDIYMSVKSDDKYQIPVSLDSINTNAHDAAISLSSDGQILFVYRDNGDDHGDIYQSNLIGETFTRPVKLKGQVNSYSWDGHCSLSPDGQTLYFSSERGGGYGGKDIYKATFQPSDSSWVNVVNLGDSINTIYDDDAPFIHPDGITLYYSSKGRSSMGGFDVFQSTMAIGDSVFRITENLGSPINTTLDDIYFVLSAYGTNGYYSSDKRGGLGAKDVYLIETNFDKPRALFMVKGKTTLNNAAAETKIVVEIMSKNNKVFKTLNSNASTGNYLITLPAGAEYKLTYTYKDKPAQTLTVSSIGIVGYIEKINDLSFGTIDTVKTVVTPTTAVTPTVAVVTPTKNNTPETFVPKNKLQAKTIAYLDKFGDVSAEGLEFRVQIAAYKFPKNYLYGHLRKLGKVDHLLMEDGITRITIGGKFATMRKAWEHNKKVVDAGQTDAYVTALYKGKRITIEQLVSMGVIVAR